MKESEIRPQSLLDRYFELSARDAKICFGDSLRGVVPCVACAGTQSTHQFDKNGFAYALCSGCGTLFQNPRPPIAAFESFYRDSESSKYWAEVFFPSVAEIRREKIFRPRVDRLAGLCSERGLDVECLIDVGAGYGILLDEWRKRSPGTRFVAVEPSASLAQECRSKGFDVVEDIVENVTDRNDTADLVTCFEVLEHVYDPLDFIRDLATLTRPGGYVFVSTLGIDGFDLQILWEKSSQISFPHHLNFLSVDGFHQLFKRAGLVDISVTTPGQLDVDIVRNAMKRDPSLLQGERFLKKLLADEEHAGAFQRFLSEQRLSSHVWVIARKPAATELSA